MPPPATAAELLDLVQKSGVTDEARLKAYLAQLAEQGGPPAEPTKVAGLLVRDGLITYFQAEQLLQGKWKRFSIGKYKVLEKLGSGGMGQVFLCEHKLMRRRVAVKVLPTAKAADGASLERFIREARAVAAVDHPNLVRAYDLDQDDNLHFLVMEYVDGTNFQDLIKKFGPLDPIRACHYIYGAAVGLQHAHEMGLVHRDIKPGNILVDRTGVVKILDLGLARFFHDTDDVLTKKYDENILGTADYLSPEQAEDSHTVDIRSDIYSLGATFYYLLTGSQPFPEGTIPLKLIWHKNREPRAIREIRPEVSGEIVAVVSRMMRKNPADRYQTPAELMAALAPWVTTPIPLPPEREMPQLSPAILNGTGRNPGIAARSMILPGPAPAGISPGSGVRISVSPSMDNLSGTPTVVQGSASLPDTPADGNGVWESLDETPSATGGDTALSPEPRLPRPLPSHPRRRRTILLAAAGLILTGAVSVGVYYLAFRKGPEPLPPPTVTTKRLVVSKAKAGAENTHATLAAALRAASSGDTITIEESPLSESFLRVNKKDLTVESGLPDGKPALIEFASASATTGTAAMLDLNEALNVRFKDLEFDGKGVADFGVQLSGNVAGVTFEGVTVRGVKKTGFLLHNAAGQSGKPVILNRVRVILSQTTDSGVRVETGGTLQSKWIAIRNSRFEGPGKFGIVFDGAVVDSEVTGNRIYKSEVGIAVGGQVPDGQPVRVQITQNTIADVGVGVLFIGPGKFESVVSRNYFWKTKALARSDLGVVTGVNSTDNGYDPQSQPGAFPLAGTKLDTPTLPPPNEADDATFLRFPGGNGPVVGPTRVGAN